MKSFGESQEAQFVFELSGEELMVMEFSVREKISAPFEVNLSLASEAEISFDDAIAKEARLSILGKEGNRHFHGIINHFMQTGVKGRLNLYKATMVPSLWLLSLEQDCRIFQNKKVTEIVEQILKERGIMGDRIAFRLQIKPQPREFCVQYRETDLDFVTRILEEEGIFYFFEHAEDKHVLVFGNSTVNYKPIEGNANVLFRPPDYKVAGEEFVSRFAFSRRIRTGKVTLRDFNFQKPAADLTAQKETKPFESLEAYQYPGGFHDESEAKSAAEVRLQQSTMFMDRAEGQSVCPRLVPGFTFNLDEHECASFNQEYLLVEVRHAGSQPQVLQEIAESTGSSYINDFFAVPATVTIRPERTILKPGVEGIQTAIVVGPEGEQIYPDEYGRVKVQFHWDREGKRDEKSSCWIRVSQAWAGQGWGAMHIPHVGQEVIVDFIEGDPDRPIITGRLYNSDNMPADTLPDEKTKSVFRDHAGNEQIVEGKEGDKHIVIKQACGNEIRMHENTPDIEIKQACGNEILMREAEGIQIRDKFGNEVVLDAVAGTLKMRSPSHESTIELGKSIWMGTMSDLRKTVDGSAFTAIHGTKDEYVVGPAKFKYDGINAKFHGGLVSDTFVGGKHTAYLAAMIDTWAAKKFEFSYGTSYKRHYSKEDHVNYATKGKRTKGPVLLDSDTKYHIIGGAGDASNLVLDSNEALINSGDSVIKIEKSGNIAITSNSNIALMAKNQIGIAASDKKIAKFTTSSIRFKEQIDHKNLVVKK